MTTQLCSCPPIIGTIVGSLLGGVVLGIIFGAFVFPLIQSWRIRRSPGTGLFSRRRQAWSDDEAKDAVVVSREIVRKIDDLEKAVYRINKPQPPIPRSRSSARRSKRESDVVSVPSRRPQRPRIQIPGGSIVSRNNAALHPVRLWDPEGRMTGKVDVDLYTPSEGEGTPHGRRKGSRISAGRRESRFADTCSIVVFASTSAKSSPSPPVKKGGKQRPRLPTLRIPSITSLASISLHTSPSEISNLSSGKRSSAGYQALAALPEHRVPPVPRLVVPQPVHARFSLRHDRPPPYADDVTTTRDKDIVEVLKSRAALSQGVFEDGLVATIERQDSIQAVALDHGQSIFYSLPPQAGGMTSPSSRPRGPRPAHPIKPPPVQDNIGPKRNSRLQKY